jgi:hypothetical protein
VVSARVLLRAASALSCACAAIAGLGGCDIILKAAYGDRHLDPRVSCDGGECVCTGGFGDCDGDVDNGCETRLDQQNNCGACGAVCKNGSCAGGSCACADGFADCDGDRTNGCEAELAGDARHCGACGNDCAGGKCVAGSCEAGVFATVSGAESLAVDSIFLYVGGCADPPITAFPTNGSPPIAAVQATGCARAITIVAGTMFWATDQGVVSNPAGAGSTTPVTLVSGVSPSRLLAGGPSLVYWWDAPQAGPRALLRVPASGGAVETIATAELGALTADDTRAYWSDPGGIHAVAHAPPPAPTDLSVTAHATALAVDALNLYAADEAGIEAFPLAGGPAKLVATPKAVGALAVSESRVYWSDPSDSTLRRAGIDGSDPVTLATGQAFVAGTPIVVDANAVYWLAEDEVRRIAK